MRLHATRHAHGARARAVRKVHGPRLRVLREIYTTERTYVRLLIALRDSIFRPLIDLARAGAPLPGAELQRFAEPLQGIIDLHEDMLARMQLQYGPTRVPITVIDELAVAVRVPPVPRARPHAHLLAPLRSPPQSEHLAARYSPYIAQYNALVALVVKLQAEASTSRFVMMVADDRRCEGQSVQALCILPIQRVPRYRLLLEELRKLWFHRATGGAVSGGSCPCTGCRVLDALSRAASRMNEDLRSAELLRVFEMCRPVLRSEPSAYVLRVCARARTHARVCSCTDVRRPRADASRFS